MKKKIICSVSLFILFSMLCLSACTNNSTTVESSLPESSFAESSEAGESVSEESKKEWVEEEEFGNTKVTRKYIDGKNDYTVTEIKYNSDGTVQSKSVSHYKQKIKVDYESIRYYDNGESSKQHTVYDENGENGFTVMEDVFTDYIMRYSFYDSTGTSQSQIEYFTPEGNKIAAGSRSKETFNGYENSTVTRLDIYENGEVVFKQTKVLHLPASADDILYQYNEITDLQNNILFSQDLLDKKEILFISGEDGVKITTENGVSVFEDLNGEFIAQVENNTITKIGKVVSADNIISFIEGKLSELQSYLEQYVSFP